MFNNIALEGISPDAVDQTAKSGGLLPAGKYHVRLDGAGDVTSKKSGGSGMELTFVVLVGAFTGQEVKETVWESENEKAKNRAVLFGHRLGVLTLNEKTKKYTLAPGKNTFADVLGAEVVVEVSHREYKKDDGTTGKAANLTFGGIWTLDDKAVKDVPKAKPGSKPPVAAKPKTVDTSGI